MRKLLALLLLCVLLTGCSSLPDFEGKWVTSVEDTLCATVLVMEGSRFTLIREGVTTTGSWSWDGGYLILYGNPTTPGDSGTAFSVIYNEAADTLTLGEWTLHRE